MTKTFPERIGSGRNISSASKTGNSQMYSLDDLQRDRPVDRKLVDESKRLMLAQMRAYALRELREIQQLTQVQLAEALKVSQNRVSRFEHGDIEKAQVDTLRRYIEALGGELKIDAIIGNQRISLA
jgi:predicted transcriptional regulator